MGLGSSALGPPAHPYDARTLAAAALGSRGEASQAGSDVNRLDTSAEVWP